MLRLYFNELEKLVEIIGIGSRNNESPLCRAILLYLKSRIILQANNLEPLSNLNQPKPLIRLPILLPQDKPIGRTLLQRDIRAHPAIKSRHDHHIFTELNPEDLA